MYPSFPQMFGSDTLIQSGVGVKSTCGGDTCMVFALRVPGRFKRHLNLDARVQQH